MHINIQSLTNKLTALELLAHRIQADVVCVSEHWLNLRTHSLFNMRNYYLASIHVRTDHTHGGVAIFANRDLICTPIEEVNISSTDFACEITAVFIAKKNLIVMTCYRTGNEMDLFLEVMNTCMAHVWNNYRRDTIIALAGDFNIDLNKRSTASRDFLNLLRSYNMKQTIFEATRIANNSKSCIDNIFTNIDSTEASVIPSMISDHECLIAKLVATEINSENKRARRLSKTNRDTFAHYIKAELWHKTYSSTTANKAFEQFLETYLTHYNNAFPLKRQRCNQGKLEIPQVIQQMRETMGLMFDAQRNLKDGDLKRIYLSYKHKYLRALEDWRKQSNADKIMSSENRQKTLWQVINHETGREQKKGSRSKMPPPEDFSRFWSEVVGKILNSLPQQSADPVSLIKRKSVATSIFMRPCSLIEVSTHIKKLKKKYSEDIYGLCTATIIPEAEVIAQPLTYIFNLCLAQGIFPDKMKMARVIPIYKKGPIPDPENYRPISILPVFSKILESIIVDRLLSFLETHNVLNPAQFGFRKSCNTEDAMQAFVHYIAEAMENHEHVSSTFCDLSRAFDTIQHPILLEKLQNYGIRGVANDLIKSYLKDRLQVVDIDGHRSAARVVNCGVAQGSICGPLFFICHINDLPDYTDCRSILYADDTTLSTSSRKIDDLQTKSKAALDTATEWFNANKFVLNKQKTTTMSFTSSKRCKELHGGASNFLGVTFDSLLTWEPQVAKTCQKLSSAIYAIRRITQVAGSRAAISAYYALFYSRMTYGISVWGHSSHSQKILILQKKALRAVAGVGPLEHCKPIFIKLRILTFHSTYLLKLMCKVRNEIQTLNHRFDIHNHELRSNSDIHYHRGRLKISYYNTIGYRAFNKLPLAWRDLPEKRFKETLKNYLLSKAIYSIEEFFSVK